ncbi:DUF6702 family protein [Hyunsoonleella aestuarii]|uniref:Peptidase E n=1 Tax=Hyunsoonleella aestuarii TaxID=912802 RepID=A0ABP8E7H5_9FLAO|nr:DUF6702 family protein [Hyunsoonleella aestuarii]
MKYRLLLLSLLLIPLFAFTLAHKYYISVTQIDYVKDKESVQIITRIFIDDFENLLRERYDENIILAGEDEPTTVDMYMERYLDEKIKIKINNEEVYFTFIGKEYDIDIVRCFLEIEEVKRINSFEISNQVLFDLFEDQQNIIKTNINASKKSYILISHDNTAVLNFN